MSRLKDLHALINSLSKSEKKSFRRFAAPTAKGESQLLVLFDALDVDEIFNQDQIHRTLKRKKIINNLPTLQRRLREQVLKSQRALYATFSIDSRLYNALEETAFLFNKRLSEQALNCLEKAGQLARKHSRTHHELIIIGWKRQVLLDLQPHGVQTQYDALTAEQENILSIQALQLKLHDLQVKVHTLTKQIHEVRNEKEAQRYQELIDVELLEAGEQSGDLLCEVFTGHIRGLHHLALGAWAAALSTYKELVNRLRDDPDWINDRPELFLTIFNNYQNALMHIATDFTEMEELLVFLREVPLRLPKNKFRFQSISYLKELLLHLNQAKFETGQVLAQEIEAWLEKNEAGMKRSLLLSFWYNLIAFYFLMGEFSEANRFANLIINLPGKDERQDIRDFTRLFQLILHHQLGNEDLIDYLRRSVIRHYKRKEKLGKFESEILDVFSPDNYSRIHIDEKQIFAPLLGKLREWKPEPPLKTLPFGLEEVRIWCQSQLTGEPIRTVFSHRIAEARKSN